MLSPRLGNSLESSLTDGVLINLEALFHSVMWMGAAFLGLRFIFSMALKLGLSDIHPPG